MGFYIKLILCVTPAFWVGRFSAVYVSKLPVNNPEILIPMSVSRNGPNGKREGIGGFPEGGGFKKILESFTISPKKMLQ